MSYRSMLDEHSCCDIRGRIDLSVISFSCLFIVQYRKLEASRIVRVEGERAVHSTNLAHLLLYLRPCMFYSCLIISLTSYKAFFITYYPPMRSLLQSLEQSAELTIIAKILWVQHNLFRASNSGEYIHHVRIRMKNKIIPCKKKINVRKKWSEGGLFDLTFLADESLTRGDYFDEILIPCKSCEMQ